MVSVIAEKGLSENGECYFVTHKPKYTRRRVSAVRDFPSGCGPNAQVINPGANNVVIDVDNAPNNGYKCGELFDIGVKMNSGSVSETQTDGKSSYSDATAKATSLFGKDGGMDVEHEGEELRKEFDNLGLVALPNGSVVETFKSSENTQKKDSESLMTELWIETHDPLKDLITAVAESSGTMKSLDSLDLKERVKDAGTQKMVEGNDMGSCSLPYYPIPSDLVWRKRKYPPRRRVSAIREFPPGCGASMASFNKNDSLKVSFKGDQLLCGDKMDAEKHADILRTDVKDLTEHVYDEDPRKAKMKGVVYGESWFQAQAESKSHKGASRSVIRPIRISDMEELQRKAEVKSHNCDESKSGKLDYSQKGKELWAERLGLRQREWLT
ncbi:hypothetical protein Nepgr_030674 [Nepenthes gracilis]|uniref:Uncharacterized protein n=1 Tax=Nepenthes gracilis TaxID=150966 RepID=A0AAD3Y6T4_NEPGR|nr:hypothetical protein Nepgr_030674 [Nepenthes gracilis]